MLKKAEEKMLSPRVVVADTSSIYPCDPRLQASARSSNSTPAHWSAFQCQASIFNVHSIHTSIVKCKKLYLPERTTSTAPLSGDKSSNHAASYPLSGCCTPISSTSPSRARRTDWSHWLKNPSESPHIASIPLQQHNKEMRRNTRAQRLPTSNRSPSKEASINC